MPGWVIWAVRVGESMRTGPVSSSDRALARPKSRISKWSPDGRKLVYCWKSGKPSELRIIGKEGDEPRTLLHREDARYIIPGGWSPDGRYISVHIEGGGSSEHTLGLIPTTGGDMRVLRSETRHLLNLGPFTPDGHHIIYSRAPHAGTPNRDIFLLATDGSGEVPFIEHPADDLTLGLSPDGEWLLFLSDRSGTSDAWVVRVEGGKTQGDPRLIKPGLGDILPLGITADGVFLYGMKSRNRDPFVLDFDPQNLKILSEPRRINERYVGSGQAPAWSFDGRSLAYISIRRPMTAQPASIFLIILNLESGEERELNLSNSIEIGAGNLRWFPDNRSLLVNAAELDGDRGLLRIDSRTAEVTPLVLQGPGERFWFSSISPDGGSIYYSVLSRSENSYRIIRLDLASGDKTSLFRTPRPNAADFPAVSPDGRHIIFHPSFL